MEHLSEIEIQQALLNEMASVGHVHEHIQECEHCKATYEGYKVLFSGIKQQEHPSFDFDLSALVLKQIAKPAAKGTHAVSFVWAFVIIATTIAFATAFLFRGQILAAFAGISVIAICLIVATALMLLLFQCVDLYRQYQKRLEILNPS